MCGRCWGLLLGPILAAALQRIRPLMAAPALARQALPLVLQLLGEQPVRARQQAQGEFVNTRHICEQPLALYLLDHSILHITRMQKLSGLSRCKQS